MILKVVLGLLFCHLRGTWHFKHSKFTNELGKFTAPASFKDEEFFINSIPTNHHTEAGLTVKGDQGFGSNERGKKYVKLNNGDRVTASGKIKTESGAKVKANKTGIYKKWKERSHNKISLKGTSGGEHDGDATNRAGNRRFSRNNRKFGSGKNKHSVPNAHVRPEVKNLEQIRKERQKKANSIEQNKGRPKRGKKKSGKKGRKAK